MAKGTAGYAPVPLYPFGVIAYGEGVRARGKGVKKMHHQIYSGDFMNL